MGKKIRLGNCRNCDGYVLVDVAGGTVTPLVEQCRHCGAAIDDSSIVDVPVIGADRDDGTVVCDDCGERWEDVDFAIVIDELGGCPSCRPAIYDSLPADT